MATVKGLFSQAITEGMNAAKRITDPYQKAEAYASLADAMARTGLVSGTNLDEAETSEATTPETKGKEALKPEANKAKATPKKKEEPKAKAKETKAEEPEVEENTEEEQEEAAAEEPELTEEWTDEMLTLKADHIGFIQQLKDDYEEEALEGCVQQFSEGTMSSLDEITPLNIDGFIAYMQALIQQQED